jgi:sec-independent protein translocase protein TatB
MGTPPIQMANLGMADSLILMVMALVVFGPRRLPQIGRQIGKLMYEFRKASNDFKFQMEEELRSAEEADRRKKEDERLRALALTTPAPAVAAIEAPVNSTTEGPTSDESVSSTTIPPATETPAEEPYPRIMPPSTGETVAAARPNSLTALAQAATESGAADAMVSEGGPAEPGGEEPEQRSAEPEQATHHA